MKFTEIFSKYVILFLGYVVLEFIITYEVVTLTVDFFIESEEF